MHQSLNICVGRAFGGRVSLLSGWMTLGVIRSKPLISFPASQLAAWLLIAAGSGKENLWNGGELLWNEASMFPSQSLFRADGWMDFRDCDCSTRQEAQVKWKPGLLTVAFVFQSFPFCTVLFQSIDLKLFNITFQQKRCIFKHPSSVVVQFLCFTTENPFSCIPFCIIQLEERTP